MAKISITKLLVLFLAITSSTILVVINSSMKTSLQNHNFGINEAWINRQDSKEEVINDTKEEVFNMNIEQEDSHPEEKFLDGIFILVIQIRNSKNYLNMEALSIDCRNKH